MASCSVQPTPPGGGEDGDDRGGAWCQGAAGVDGGALLPMPAAARMAVRQLMSARRSGRHQPVPHIARPMCMRLACQMCVSSHRVGSSDESSDEEDEEDEDEDEDEDDTSAPA